MNLLILIVFGCLFLAGPEVESKPFEKEDSPKCGYNSCNKAKLGALNVHVVPHSHDDVGWLKTVDQYFYGTKTNYQRADVNAIITSVVKALQENAERRFIQVETAFFYKWWHQQSDATKDIVRGLVESGQLEFTGGAWSMNDEAAVHYHSVIDQFTFGLKFLNDTFGECGRPRIGWQIDPFGHSSEMASMFAQMGYDGLFFARVDWRDKLARMNSATAEMIWQGSHSLGNASNIFTSLLFNHYSAPAGFCFDVLCSEDPIVTNQLSTEYNFREKVAKFKAFAVGQSLRYKTRNVLITMGDDFNYQDAISYFRNMDTLISGFQIWPQTYKDVEINVFYSTPACYVKAVNEEVNANGIELPLETYDFFPYASDHHSYWSGYFTSRPVSKFAERLSNNLLQIHKQMGALHSGTRVDEFFDMQNAVGIMQHHDAITGTEKQHVADDYMRIMNNGYNSTMSVMGKHISALLAKDGNPSNFDLEITNIFENPQRNQSFNDLNFTMFVYNLQAHTHRYAVRHIVDSLNYVITGPDHEIIPYQIVPWITDKHVLSDRYEITFIADLPPLGITAYHFKPTASTRYEVQVDSSRSRYKLGNQRTTGITIDPSTGLLEAVTINSIELKVQQALKFYYSKDGNNAGSENRASGAYIFRNKTGGAHPINAAVNVTTYKGDLFDEVRQNFTPWATQIIRVYKDETLANSIEFEWIVGPIPIDDKDGKEVISHFATNLNTADDFYTDSNGREMIRRRRNYRPTYNYTNEEPIAGNYHPVTAQLTITDGDVRMSVLTDRAQGGTSLKSGEMELMIHRRCLHDDAFGVGEALNDSDIVRGRHYLMLNKHDQRMQERLLADKIVLGPWKFIAYGIDMEEFDAKFHRVFSGLNEALSENVKVLTLEPWSSAENIVLLRLENTFDSDFGTTEMIDLTKIFANFKVRNVREMLLAGNVDLQMAQQTLQWKQYPKVPTFEKRNSVITLDPMQIRTYLVEVEY